MCSTFSLVLNNVGVCVSPLLHTRECEHEGVPVFLFVFFPLRLARQRNVAAQQRDLRLPLSVSLMGFSSSFFFWFSDELPDFNPEK